ncbi:MAG: UDP-N-acetylmuramoyl-L-alanyl-D-glutamate--2,6-diaminopimelate ligase [Gammaproteobacteria bacterium]|nr:UDP-N-acetylmuramoyl-L-alanyl-D-glutamate--2,6-diaminopimelate ligase [Gammaproteobacteria bacterium]
MSAAMTLRALCPTAPGGGLDIGLTGLNSDSRRVRRGELFLASGDEPAAHIQQAVDRGAAAVIWDASVSEEITLPTGVAGFPLTNLQRERGNLASRFFGEPSEHIQVIGVTGTNGKTSVCHFLGQALDRCAVIGTLGNGFPGSLDIATHTTPDAVDFHRFLSEMRAGGAEQVAAEISSHALVQQRVGGVRFACAVFTNLGRDHLDYHGDMASYLGAKAELFHWPGLRHAVINLDDPAGCELAKQLPQGVPLTGYGEVELPGVVSVRADDRELLPTGLGFTLVAAQGQGRVEVPLLGGFNINNLLAVAAVLVQFGLPIDEVVSRLQRIRPVAGRMERLVRPDGAGPTVVLDYAHNPHGLEQVLLTLRQHMAGLTETGGKAGRLICLFGCGGDRDRGKRPMMGALAERLADAVVLTSDNPRSENPESILDEIQQGMVRVDELGRISDRAEAIARGIAAAGSNDWVLIAGKGDEREQLIGRQRIPFSDRVEICRALDVWS